MSTRGFKGLTEVRALTDEQARALVLGNWHKLNGVLRARPSSEDLQRLLALELRGDARPDLCRRLRAALSRALGRDAEEAMESTLAWLAADKPLSRTELMRVGLSEWRADWVMGLRGAKGVAQDAERWRESHPRQLAWLRDQQTAGNDFALSLMKALGTFGGFTEKQQQALDRVCPEQAPANKRKKA